MILEAVLGGIVGYIGGWLGLGSLCIVGAANGNEQLVVMGVSGFLTSTAGGYESIEGQSSGVNWRQLGIAVILGLGYALVGQMFGKSLLWSLAIYAIGVIWSWKQSGWLTLLILLGMAGLHLVNMPIYGIFAGCSLARLWITQRQKAITPEREAQLAAAVAGVIPGVNPQFLCRLRHGTRYQYESVSYLEPYYEWGAVVSYLVAKVADGKTVLGGILWGVDKLDVLIAASVAFCLVLLLPHPKQKLPPKVTTLLQALGFWLITALQSPIACLTPVLIAFCVVKLHRQVDLQGWLIPAYVVSSLL